MSFSASGCSVSGPEFATGCAAAGTPVPLRFVFYDDAGSQLGNTSVTVAAPAPGESTTLEIQFASQASGYRYEYIAPPPADTLPAH